MEAGLRRQAGVQGGGGASGGRGDEAMLVGYVEAKSGVTLNRLSPCAGLQATLLHYMGAGAGSSRWMPKPAAAERVLLE